MMYQLKTFNNINNNTFIIFIYAYKLRTFLLSVITWFKPWLLCNLIQVIGVDTYTIDGAFGF